MPAQFSQRYINEAFENTTGIRLAFAGRAGGGVARFRFPVPRPLDLPLCGFGSCAAFPVTAGCGSVDL